ncbi:glycosyltransferase family 4 protein [Rubrivirga sp.]|uniref:glycosyltransferase family 4 protein n=1 Tax=Rubrivirga sp. TaxID=1885344 RepID=UPI003C7430D1
MRIAFLTPEFVTEMDNRGGLANYLNRMSQALVERGHHVEVFTLSDHEGRLDHGGVTVHRVPWPTRGLPFRALTRIAGHLRLYAGIPPARLAYSARRVAAAFHARDAAAPFDIVQSSDFNAVGLFVRPDPRRTHLVRCSWAADHFMRVDGVHQNRSERWKAALERAAIRRADVAYAPSQFVADYYRETFGYDVGVIRPPVLVEVEAASEPPDALPDRYLLHFGSLRVRKGTDVLAKALPLAWREAPDLAMVWAGGADPAEMERWQALWGERVGQVHWINGLAKPHLYAVLQRAVATVLPTRADNLPNTVIESLLFGVPVVGSDGASVDELVRDGIDGALVPIGDADVLAQALVRAWHGELPRPTLDKHPVLSSAMTPDAAVDAFLRAAGHATTVLRQPAPTR